MIRQGAPTRPRRKPTEWELRQELERRDRERNYRELMTELAQARDNRDHWYTWVADGRPPLTEAEYSRVSGKHSSRNQRTESPRNRGKEEPWTGSRDVQETIA